VKIAAISFCRTAALGQPLRVLGLPLLLGLVFTCDIAAAEPKFGFADNFLPLPLSVSSRDDFDTWELQELEKASPEARRLLESGERAHGQGKYELALQSYEQAAAKAPSSSLVQRRMCEARPMLKGQREQALAVCQRAVGLQRTPGNMRAFVGALMTGSGPLGLKDLEMAQAWTETALKLKPDRHWGHASQCDIAFRLGDRGLGQQCLSQLKRVAPHHAETKRAMAMQPPVKNSPWRALAWVGVGVATLGTLIHAMWRALGRSRVSASGARAAVRQVAGLLFIATLSASAFAQDPDPSENLSRFPIDKANPEKSVPSAAERDKAPLQYGYWLMDVTDLAERALVDKNYEEAAKYYRALAKAVPDVTTAYSKLCTIYQLMNKPVEALAACARPLNLKGVTFEDYSRYLRAMISNASLLKATEIDYADSVVNHLLSLSEPDPVAVLHLSCELAVKLSDAQRLDKCVRVLFTKAPNDAKTVSFQWLLAVRRGKFEEARGLVERARSTKMLPAGVAQMTRATELEFQKSQRRRLYGMVPVAALAVAGAIFLATRRRKAG